MIKFPGQLYQFKKLGTLIKQKRVEALKLFHNKPTILPSICRFLLSMTNWFCFVVQTRAYVYLMVPPENICWCILTYLYKRKGKKFIQNCKLFGVFRFIWIELLSKTLWSDSEVVKYAGITREIEGTENSSVGLKRCFKISVSRKFSRWSQRWRSAEQQQRWIAITSNFKHPQVS